MRTLILTTLTCFLWGCGSNTCEDACAKMSKCFGFDTDVGGSSSWECPLGIGTCDAQKKCFARCNLDATCDEIKNKAASYIACKDECAKKYFGDSGTQQKSADSQTAPEDGGVGGDQTAQYWQCHYGAESFLLASCSFAWTCPSGDDRVLECTQSGETHNCTCKNHKKETTDGTFSSEDICSKLPAQEVTDRVNKLCGWKIKETKESE